MFLLNNILIFWLSWHFVEVPRVIFRGLRNFLLFNLNYFSLPFLLKTFFNPWRHYLWSYGPRFDPARYIEVFISNSFSRFIGMILRSFLIITGLLVEIFIFFVGLIIILLWLVLPLILVLGIYYGFRKISL
jgi:hypothetical protein